MPAQKDRTAWKPVDGDHADDQTYKRIQRDHPRKQPTDEKRTQEEIRNAEQANKEAAKAAKDS